MAKKTSSRARTTKASKSPRRGGSSKKTGKVSPPAPSPQAQARQDAYHAALALYKSALESLQRRQFDEAATAFQQVIDDYPEERELHERCRLYLQVCERESQPPPELKTVEERVYAATLALNSGSQEDAIAHLEAALKKAPNSDHVQYMLAVARAAAGDTETAASHLLRSIELNPDNRFIARQESSFDVLRDDEAIQDALKTPAARNTGS